MPECPERCTAAGITFARIIRDQPEAVVLFPDNVKGLVQEESYKVPHSELAMYVSAAGKDIIAWSLTEGGRYAHIVFLDDKGCCHNTHGLPTEVMTHELIRTTKGLLGMKE